MNHLIKVGQHYKQQDKRLPGFTVTDIRIQKDSYSGSWEVWIFHKVDFGRRSGARSMLDFIWALDKGRFILDEDTIIVGREKQP